MVSHNFPKLNQIRTQNLCLSELVLRLNFIDSIKTVNIGHGSNPTKQSLNIPKFDPHKIQPVLCDSINKWVRHESRVI